MFSIFVGPLVLGALWLLLTRTRWGLLVRAATQDREMVGALGVNQRWLFTSVFALGTFLAALGGALQMPHEPANLNLDLALIGEAFVVVVVGGMGSIPGAFVAAILIAMVKAFCIAAGTIDVFGAPFPLSKLTLVAEFLVMAVVLVWRPSGLFGKPQGAVRGDAGDRGAAAAAAARLAPRRLGRAARRSRCVAVARAAPAPYAIVLMIDVLIAVLFAASLHFLMGPAGMHSFGHAAYFGLGAYGAALCFKALGAADGGVARCSRRCSPRSARFVFGWFCVRLSGVYLAMLTLAFAQIVWSVVFQWDARHRRQQRPGRHLAAAVAGAASRRTTCSCSPARSPAAACSCACCTRRSAWRCAASRDSPLRAAAIGIDVPRLQWIAFVVAGTFAGAGRRAVRLRQGSISPETLGVARRSTRLVMVLLGGVQRGLGPVGRRRALHLAAGHASRARPTTGARCSASSMLALVLVVPARRRRRR